jgi:glycosyltransferase involved in cell wall biosynthesis
MDKPKVLVFIDWFYPAYKAGGPITSCYNAVVALKKYFDFYIVTSNTDYLEETPLPNIISNQWVEENGLNIYYCSKNKLSINFIRSLIKNQPHQVLWINGFFSFYFSILPAFFAINNVRTIISTRGMLGDNVLQFKGFKKRAYIFISKILHVYSGKIFHATNSSEKRDIEKLFKNKTIVASNIPFIGEGKLELFPEKKEGELRILQVARIAKEKNTLFGIEVISELKGKVTFDIVGSIYDKRYAEECISLSENLDSEIEINFLGSKSPFELRKLIYNYDLFFLPTLGENFGHAITESLGSGLPVLISDKTPWKNLETSLAGFELPLKKDLFLEKLNFFLGLNHIEFLNWRRGALAFFSKEIDMNKIIQQNLKLFTVE